MYQMRTLPLLLCLLQALGCSRTGGTSPSSPEDSGQLDSGTSTVELCDGEDNDGDGVVDEDWPDQDEDGTVDCLQCAVEEWAGKDVGAEQSCSDALIPPDDPWSVELIWEVAPPEFGLYGQGCWANAVGDLDGDGFAEVLCQGENLTVLSSLNEEVFWSTERLTTLSPTAIGDLDGDGELEVVGFDDDGYIVCFNAYGSVEWVSEVVMGRDEYGAQHAYLGLETVDVNGDGILDVITHHGIASGLDGTLLSALFVGEDVFGSQYEPIAAGDLRQDGGFLVAHRGVLYQSDGTVLWSQAAAIDEGTSSVSSPLLVQADDDDAAEIMWLREGGQVLTDTDGTILNEVAYSGDIRAVGVGCAGDLDGDGAMDIVSAGAGDPTLDSGIIQARTMDGALMWEILLSEEAVIGFGSCSTFDFDMDGAQEVLIVDREFFYILDGRDGSVHYSYAHYSGAVFDTPMVVDLDGDGSVEIVVPNRTGYEIGTWPNPTPDAGFRVFGHTENAWPPGGRIWPHQNWSGSGMRSDGRADPNAEAPWLSTGLYRGQPTVVVEGADLRAELVDSCAAESEVGEVRVSVRWVNGGPWEAEAATPMAVYALADDGTRQALLDVLSLSEELSVGEASPSVELVYARQDIGAGLEMVAGDDGTSTVDERDCDKTNNSAWFTP